MTRCERRSLALERQAALASANILIVPGIGGSGPRHWQSLFEGRHANAQRVHQDDWSAASLDAWAERIATAALAAQRPVLVVAHSFGCLATVRAAANFAAPIAGALLVAPADPGRFGIPDEIIRCRLEAVSLVIASNNDPWLTPARALGLAQSWDSDYLNVGPVGHINVASGFGNWPEVDRLAGSVYQAMSETLVPFSAPHHFGVPAVAY